jgi:two-component system sensor histidine kinase BaeS
MSRLWVRLSLMISGVLLLVFLLQFTELMLTRHRAEDPYPPPSTAEIKLRLYRFMALSVVVGLAAGFGIGHLVSSPISALARAARQVGSGQLRARVPVQGSREMRDLAETFNKMAAALQRAEAARNNLMADVSHELRTPLTVLEANLRAALDRVQVLDEAGIANLYSQSRHLIRLVNDLRELSLAETGKLTLEKTPTDLRLLVQETVQALEPFAIEKQVQILAEVPALVSAQIDPLRIRQVLFNLLSNALRHTPPGGSIRILGSVDSVGIKLVFEDTGEGLTAEQLDSVFNRFYRADKSRSRETGGTGLGLAIVKAIVEAHGGTVSASSRGKDQGCCFTLCFPESSISATAS